MPLTTAAALRTSPSGDLVVGIAVCHSGPIPEGERIVRAVKEYGPPVMDSIEPTPYPVFQRSLDDTSPHGRRYYLKSQMLNNIDDGAIDALVDHFADVPSPQTLVLLFQLGGAIDRLPGEHTAYHQRGAAYRLAIVSAWEDPADDASEHRMGTAVRSGDAAIRVWRRLRQRVGRRRTRPNPGSLRAHYL